MKKFLVFGAVLALAILAIVDFQETERSSSRKVRPRGFEVRRQASAGGWDIPARKAEKAVEVELGVDSPLDVADKYLRKHRDELGLKPYHEMRSSVFQTPLGARVTYQTYQDGVPIVGGVIRMQIGRNHDVIDVDSRYVPWEKVELRESDLMTGEQVQELIRTSNYLADPSVARDPARVMYPVPGTNRVEMAYVVAAREPAGDRRPVQLLLRATDGQLLVKNYSRVEFSLSTH